VRRQPGLPNKKLQAAQLKQSYQQDIQFFDFA
jgi:hypothetical protein